MESREFLVRHATEADFDGWYDLMVAVAGEGRWIGRELPVNREDLRERFLPGVRADPADDPATAFVAVAATSGVLEGRQIGHLYLRTYVGIGEIGMAVDAGWRGRGVGSALLGAAIAWARDQQLHKMTLQLWPHNEAAKALYLKHGFVEEGHLHRHYRRKNGELWDALIMGLTLDTTSPGSSY